MELIITKHIFKQVQKMKDNNLKMIITLLLKANQRCSSINEAVKSKAKIGKSLGCQIFTTGEWSVK